ncbi:MAG: Tn3 family transposase [Thermoplasmata archaeon]
MGTRDRQRDAYFRVIRRLWSLHGKVRHRDFSRALERARAHMGPELRSFTPPLTPDALAHRVTAYFRQQGVNRRPRSWLRKALVEALHKGAIDPDLRDADLRSAARQHLLSLRVVVPLDGPLGRLVRSARTEVAGQRREGRLLALETDLGVVLRDLPLVRKAEAAQRLRQYPPVWKGKANLLTMAREAKIMAELDTAIVTSGLPREVLLASPDLDRHRRVVENLPPAHLKRREKYFLVESIPFATVARWRDARDTVLYCFVRKARLLRANLEELEGKALRDASLAFLERSTPRFRALHRTILRCLETRRVDLLESHRSFVAALEREGLRLTEEETYYELLSDRGGYSRKMARRLVGIPFVPRDPHARAIVGAFGEVARLAPFQAPIPEPVVASLAFLDVRPDQLRRRRVFEPVVLMTLADLLWSGRVTVPGSRRYRDRWKDVPPPSPPPEGWSSSRWVAEQRRRLEAAGALFRQRAHNQEVIREGHLHVPRPRKERTAEGEEVEEEPRPLVRLPRVGIVELLWKVHDATGFLDAFQLAGPATKRLSEEDRRRLALAILLALGLNLGLVGASRALGRGFALWRLRNFAANYVTEATLRDALDRIVQTWDRLGLGRPWGPGTTGTMDGRALPGLTSNLVSEVHYRRKRRGVTIYWVVRDDDIAVAVRIIGNFEWESWFVLDDLARPAGGRALEVSTGDTHGQHLAAWGLASLMGKRMTVRFRQFGQVKVYGTQGGRWCGLERVGAVDWARLRRSAHSLQRLGESVKTGRVVPSEILRMANVYDEEGVNVMEGLRELGKIARTEFLLSFATDPALREEVHRQRQQMEAWNAYERGVCFGRGGQIVTNDPERWAEMGLAKAVVLNAIPFYNVWRHGGKLRRNPSAKPIVWGHVDLL